MKHRWHSMVVVRCCACVCASIAEESMNDMLLTSKSVTDRPPELTENGGALFVTFKIAYQYCALPLAETLEVVRLPALVELAGAPPTLCGLLNLRGRYIP